MSPSFTKLTPPDFPLVFHKIEIKFNVDENTILWESLPVLFYFLQGFHHIVPMPKRIEHIDTFIKEYFSFPDLGVVRWQFVDGSIQGHYVYFD